MSAIDQSSSDYEAASANHAKASSDSTDTVAAEAPGGIQHPFAPTLETTSAPVWVRRLAVTLVVLVWPLIWVGGLVTTYDAGMSVPDWPGTYGYNLFLYPLSTWLLGPFDLFIEHGHRLLGALVGFVAIGFLATAWGSESRRWVVLLAVGVLIAVIGQGVLGGLRVTMSARTLAMVHGCTGPAFFALCVVAACVTSPRWSAERVAKAAGDSPRTPPSAIWGVLLVGLAYLQLVLGAQLRHALPTVSPGGFAHITALHVLTAAIVWILTGLVWWKAARCGDLTLSRPAGALVCFVGVQIVLGIGTWIVNYGYPPVLQTLPGSQTYLLQSKNVIDAWIVTGHVATGSLILAVATLWTVRRFRRRHVLA